MNLETKTLPVAQTEHPCQEPAGFPCEANATAASACILKEETKPMKLLGFRRPVFVIAGMALCMGITSCVDPSYSQGGGSVTVTNSRYSPGYRINSLPGGYRSETISGSTYYYHDGYYYRQNSGGYVIVDAPRTSRYYGDYSSRQRISQPGRDYRDSRDRDDRRYERTEVITRLPDGYREVNHRGQRYYQSGDRYYRRQGESYMIVTSPF